MAVTVKIMVSACSHVECTVNSSRRAALGSIEGEILATTALVTSVNPEVASIVDMKGSVRVFLHKVTVLKRKKEKKETKHLKWCHLWHNESQLY